MNEFLKKAAAIFGFTTERVEKMTADEKKKLESYGETASNLEAERDTAIQDLDTANARVTELEGQLASETEAREAAEGTVSTHEARISELENEVAEKDAQIAKLPGASTTTVTKTDSDPKNKTKKPVIRSWEKVLHER